MVYRQLEASREKPYSIQGFKGIHSRMVPHERYCREARMRLTFCMCGRGAKTARLAGPSLHLPAAGPVPAAQTLLVAARQKSGHSARPGAERFRTWPDPSQWQAGAASVGRRSDNAKKKNCIEFLKKQKNIVCIVINIACIIENIVCIQEKT
jgi:hypothetical protein